MTRQEAQKRLIRIHNRICKQEGIQPLLKVNIRNSRRGHCGIDYINVPVWTYKDKMCSKYYFYYYVIHETIHHIVYSKYNTFSHGNEFMRHEKSYLKRYGLKVKYKRVYVEYNVLKDRAIS